jgi:DNA uptake protein ComE-like DNA-binding protein
MVEIDITYGKVIEQPKQNIVYPKNTINNNQPEQESKKEEKEKIDINNASEVEITALPGISIVTAKKLIRKREDIGGFKSVDDVCNFLHLKPHLEKQLRELICINKMKGSLKISRNKERSVDL